MAHDPMAHPAPHPPSPLMPDVPLLQPAPAQSLEADFFRLHEWVIRAVTYVFKPEVLRFFEYCLMMGAVMSLLTLTFLHVVFVEHEVDQLGGMNTSNCLVEEVSRRVESCGDAVNVVVAEMIGEWSRVAKQRSGKVDSGFDGDFVGSLLEDPAYMFAKERGFLLLKKEVREKHRIKDCAFSLQLDCFGSSYLMYILDNFVGYDTVMVNTFMQWTGKETQGFMRSDWSNRVVDLAANRDSHNETANAEALRRFWMAMVIGLLYLVSTILLNRAVCESQNRTMLLSKGIQQRLKRGLPYLLFFVHHLLGILVFIPLLLGMLFSFAPIYQDHFLTFMVLTAVWLCELVAVVAVRTEASARGFPRNFFIYFVCFHVYLFSYPSGFVFLAAAVMIVFMLHSILFYWNRYEVPALNSGSISASRPQETRINAELDMPLPSLATRFILGVQKIGVVGDSGGLGKMVPPNQPAKLLRQKSKKRATLRSPPLDTEELFTFKEMKTE